MHTGLLTVHLSYLTMLGDLLSICPAHVSSPESVGWSFMGLDASVSDSSLLQDNVAFVLCLDTLGRGNSLHLHVSKPPKEGTLQHAFLRELEMVTKNVNFVGEGGSCMCSWMGIWV